MTERPHAPRETERPAREGRSDRASRQETAGTTRARPRDLDLDVLDAVVRLPDASEDDDETSSRSLSDELHRTLVSLWDGSIRSM